MRINSTEGRLKSVTASIQGGKSNCNGSLAYGDIGFGNGELNWKLVKVQFKKEIQTIHMVMYILLHDAFHKWRRDYIGDT